MIENLVEKALSSQSIQSSPHIIRLDSKIETPLFKATKKEYYEALMDTGEVYLNTFFNLAKEEEYGRGVGDLNEGSRQFVYSGDRFNGDPLMGMVSAVNSYMFCCASILTKELVSVWKPTAAYMINSIRFFESISEVMASETTTTIISPVYYGNWMDFDVGTRRVSEWIDRNNEPDTPPQKIIWPSVAYMKDADLAYQHEVRATWEPPFSPEQQIYVELTGGEAEVNMEKWRSNRMELLSSNAVRFDIQPKSILVPGIQQYVDKVDLTSL